MKVLAFGFQENSSGEIIWQLDERVHKVALESDAHAIDSFIAKTNFEDYDYIVGVSSYSGIDNDKIRMETVCTSQFRNNKTDLVHIKIQPFFQSTGEFKLGNHMGNSYCNLVCHKLLEKHPGLKFTFLHVPKSYSQKNAAREINNQLRNSIQF